MLPSDPPALQPAERRLELGGASGEASAPSPAPNAAGTVAQQFSVSAGLRGLPEEDHAPPPPRWLGARTGRGGISGSGTSGPAGGLINDQLKMSRSDGLSSTLCSGLQPDPLVSTGSEEEDANLRLPSNSSSPVLQWEYHILYSCSYATPVLYFRAFTLGPSLIKPFSFIDNLSICLFFCLIDESGKKYSEF